MKLKFMGQEFDTPSDLAKAFPRYGTPDVVPLIRAGASTPHEVEVAAWKKRNRGKAKPKQAPLRVKTVRKPKRRAA